ncbi:MAG: hypothetical protein AN487_05425 [Anabaena sp. CRKS33]|nr:MAG: hypothetical protein AN487_05425 [Anabaena sp. CRKS33]
MVVKITFLMLMQGSCLCGFFQVVMRLFFFHAERKKGFCFAQSLLEIPKGRRKGAKVWVMDRNFIY